MHLNCHPTEVSLPWCWSSLLAWASRTRRVRAAYITPYTRTLLHHTTSDAFSRVTLLASRRSRFHPLVSLLAFVSSRFRVRLLFRGKTKCRLDPSTCKNKTDIVMYEFRVFSSSGLLMCIVLIQERNCFKNEKGENTVSIAEYRDPKVSRIIVSSPGIFQTVRSEI